MIFMTKLEFEWKWITVYCFIFIAAINQHRGNEVDGVANTIELNYFEALV